MNPLNDHTQPLYPLRVAADLTHTSVYALRQYVDLGLVIPHRTVKNRRLYSLVDIMRVRCIRKYIDEYGLNIAGVKTMFSQVPCWLIRPCSQADRQACDAYTAITEPCWNVKNKGVECQQADCRTCNVYRLPETCTDPKALMKHIESLDLKNLIPNRNKGNNS